MGLSRRGPPADQRLSGQPAGRLSFRQWRHTATEKDTKSVQELSLMPGSGRLARCWVPALVLAGVFVSADRAQEPAKAPPSSGERLDHAAVRQIVTGYCTSCHDGSEKKGGLDLEAVSSEDVAAHPEVWEKVARTLAARQMPPAGRKRPDERAYASFVTGLEAELDRIAAKRPNPGRTPTVRRLNRTEYQVVA